MAIFFIYMSHNTFEIPVFRFFAAFTLKLPVYVYMSVVQSGGPICFDYFLNQNYVPIYVILKS